MTKEYPYDLAPPAVAVLHPELERRVQRCARYKISNAALARQMCVDPTMVSRWFHGRSTPTLASLSRMDVAITWLIDAKKAARKA